MDFTNKETVLETMIEWEHEHGESILDGRFGSDIVLPTFMSWALGAKYITPKQFDAWYSRFVKSDFNAEELQCFLYDDYGDGEIDYAIVTSRDGKWNEDEYHKAYGVVAHFVSDFTIYQIKFKLFLEEGIW